MVRIAVIDDSPDFAEVMTEVLGDHGWEVTHFAETSCILPRLRCEQPDVIMLDLHLVGRTDGWDLLAQFELDPVLHGIPVIVCSAASNELRDRAPWLEERGIASLEKPFNIDELYQVIEASLHGDQLRFVIQRP